MSEPGWVGSHLVGPEFCVDVGEAEFSPAVYIVLLNEAEISPAVEGVLLCITFTVLYIVLVPADILAHVKDPYSHRMDLTSIVMCSCPLLRCL